MDHLAKFCRREGEIAKLLNWLQSTGSPVGFWFSGARLKSYSLRHVKGAQTFHPKHQQPVKLLPEFTDK
jgi:hypothetical protein